MTLSCSVPIGDVLTITTGRMLSDRGILGLRGLMAFMTGVSNDLNNSDITDTACMALADRCKSELVRQHPWLGELSDDEMGRVGVDEWLRQVADKHGEAVQVLQFNKRE